MMLQSMLQQACEDSGQTSYYNAYSGRCMYGKTCVGITGSRSQCMNVISETIKQLRYKMKLVQLGSSEEEQDRLFDQAIDLLLGGMREDQMGHDIIVYWPTLEPIPDYEEEQAS